MNRFEERYGGSPTSSLLDVTHDAERSARALVAGLRPLPHQCGVLLGLAGQPVQLEAFDSWQTLEAVWDALLLSAALDAITLPAVATPGRRARRFVDRVSAVPLGERDGGVGTGLTGRSPYARVEALAWRGRTVHAVAVNPRHELVAA